MNKKTAIRIAKKFANYVKKSGIPVVDAYLFGSTVTGKTHIGSDIDICIISPIFGKDRQKERLKLMKIQDKINYMIEPHPLSPKDFNNPYNSLSYQIKKTGIKI
ncbi:MAG: hypothetical protein Fur009_8050 [Candidatus Microgenomates bacterium]